ncbi:hypothetical protein JOD43_002154 [Pullulanibacillus pueri]|uniref:Uncharacterized protein n=1 Tax=Pullulanibacillus pueri TaxID=1437324 RepID=A0A8J2ZXH8_9BACL|nr:hypothetical protein [Pullulanibacillus pueri]MBM7681982.1 hypothetical protein [Pullulanibacillus pueri]GGH83656.1 hypothetical protein GCM10007096_24910 [Pullulanibacillus pueri]
MLDNFFKVAADRLDDYLTGRLFVEEGQVFLGTDGEDIALDESYSIDIQVEDDKGTRYVPVTYKDVLERKTDAGWHLFAGLDARVKRVSDMTVGEMLGYTNRFKNIIASKASERVKTIRLAAMMTDLEFAYDIPMINKESFAKANPHVMRLYRTVSEARVF